MAIKKVTYSALELMDKSYAFVERLGRHAKTYAYDRKNDVHVYTVSETFYNMYLNED